MRKILTALFLVALASACTTTAGAPQADTAARDCFRTLDVSGYGVVDDRRIRVHVSPQREYILTIGQTVRNLDWTHAISIRSVSSFVCVGNGLGVQLLGGDPPLTYSVVQVERAPQETATPQGS
jgi:hypothetical protein